MNIFKKIRRKFKRKLKKVDVKVRLNSEKATRVNLSSWEEGQVFWALKSDSVYEAIGYMNHDGKIVCVRIKQFPNTCLSARIFDFL